MENLNMLKIDVFNANGNIASERSGENQKSLWKTHGITEINTMVGYIQLINGDGKPSRDYRDKRMVAVNPIRDSCTLIEELEEGKEERRIYDIYIEPHFFNTNPNGECGGAITFELTLKSGDNTLINELPFWYRCRLPKSHGLANRWEERIDSIQFLPNDGSFYITGSYWDEDKEEYIRAYKYFSLEKDMPITDQTLYVTDPYQ